ncbi:BQ2448_6946 [Microbotryum intermedium]|uniref:BQ2448_6946 protein n=1 Tax=Microbotryum intermedium TaxID=269621 RepID=A0A238FLI1_9BASI|nr:BQ2448_6946 [Microbotryum intermedium]
MHLSIRLLVFSLPFAIAHPHPDLGSSSPSSLEEREGAGAQVFARHLGRLKLKLELETSRSQAGSASATDAVDGSASFRKRQSTTSSGEGQTISSDSNSPEHSKAPSARSCSLQPGRRRAETLGISSTKAAGYSCDNTTCVLPSCHCASVNPPGGLSPKNTPQFISESSCCAGLGHKKKNLKSRANKPALDLRETRGPTTRLLTKSLPSYHYYSLSAVTADDAVNTFTIEVLNYLLSQRKNPNGCQPKMTYFNSLMYSNYSMVTDWFVAGNEIADHTMTHVGDPPANEINGNLAALNAFSGIPLVEVRGFRAPMLNFSSSTLSTLHTSGFLYDSSATSASPADAAATDAYWPYTLDNGLANNCLDLTGVCKGALKLPGLWEIPMYAVFGSNNASDIHLMDPWLDSDDMSEVLAWLKSSFLSHYNGTRQPFGLYTHPIHLAVNYPGLANPTAQREMLQEFLDWAQTYPDVWFVTNQQLLAWMQDPQSNDQIAQSTALQCSTPAVDATLKICNGVQQNEAGLLLQCPFTDFSWTTCYGCPVTPPTPQNPVPAQNTSLGVRAHLPTNCSTPFFDPVGNRCTCAATSCAFTDQTRPIGNYSTPLSDANSKTGAAGGSTSTSSRGSSMQTSIPRQSSDAPQLLTRVTLAVASAVATLLILLG